MACRRPTTRTHLADGDLALGEQPRLIQRGPVRPKAMAWRTFGSARTGLSRLNVRCSQALPGLYLPGPRQGGRGPANLPRRCHPAPRPGPALRQGGQAVVLSGMTPKHRRCPAPGMLSRCGRAVRAMRTSAQCLDPTRECVRAVPTDCERSLSFRAPICRVWRGSSPTIFP